VDNPLDRKVWVSDTWEWDAREKRPKITSSLSADGRIILACLILGKVPEVLCVRLIKTEPLAESVQPHLVFLPP
jgi:hypothetical protein